MANLPLHLPSSNFRTFTLTATASTSNGVPFNNNNNNNNNNNININRAKSGGGGGGGGPVILEIPMDKIRRPLMRTRSNDPEKVKDLMDSIQQIGLQVPIDVLEVDGVYYGFSGCHRYEAHQRLGLPTIRCKVRRGTKETLRHHLR